MKRRFVVSTLHPNPHPTPPSVLKSYITWFFFSWNRTLSGLRSPITPSPALFTIFSCIFYLSLFFTEDASAWKVKMGFFSSYFNLPPLKGERPPHSQLKKPGRTNHHPKKICGFHKPTKTQINSCYHISIHPCICCFQTPLHSFPQTL